MDLVFVQYKGIDYRDIVARNLNNNFERDCGLQVTERFVEPARDELIEMLTNRAFQNETIIHFVGHGLKGVDGGIAQLVPGRVDVGLKDSVVSWNELVILFNQIANRCPQLYVNLGTVCYSDGILNVNSEKNFGYLVTTIDVGDPVTPRKANKQFIECFEGQRNQYSDLGSNYMWGNN